MRILAAGPSSDLDLANTGEDRPAGVHLSDILSRMAWEKDRKYNPDAEKDLMIFEQGHTWETVLSRALAARQNRPAGYRPEPMQEDGVWLSPDWINPEGQIQVEEWKATKKSLKSYEQKIDEWAPQGMSYLRAALKRGTAKSLVVLWRVWFIVGDWSFEAKGDLTLLRDYWDIPVEFTKRDLEENWRRVIAFGHKCGLLKGEPEQELPRSWRGLTGSSNTVVKRTAVRGVGAPGRSTAGQKVRGSVNAGQGVWLTKKKSSNPPDNSRAKARVITFPTTKKLLKRRSES
jgi:hypothetical protein